MPFPARHHANATRQDRRRQFLTDRYCAENSSFPLCSQAKLHRLGDLTGTAFDMMGAEQASLLDVISLESR